MLSELYLFLLIEETIDDSVLRALCSTPLHHVFPQIIVQIMHLIVDFVGTIDPVPEYPLWNDFQPGEDIDRRRCAESVNTSPDFQQGFDLANVWCIDGWRPDTVDDAQDNAVAVPR